MKNTQRCLIYMESNTEKFTKIFHKYSDPVFRHLYFRLGDRGRALEITQEVFMRFWRVLNEGQDIENEKAFLYRIAHNLYVNELRDRKPTMSLDKMSEEENFDPREDSHEDMINKIDAGKAVELFSRLGETERVALTLRFVDDFTIKEIAEYVDEPENTVSVRIHRAIKKLKGIMEDSEKNV